MQIKQNMTIYSDLEVICPACNSIGTHTIESYNLMFLECESCSKIYLCAVHQGYMIRTFCERLDTKSRFNEFSSDAHVSTPQFN